MKIAFARLACESQTKVLDLNNNELGISIAQGNPVYLLNPYGIYELVLTAISNGEGVRLLNDSSNGALIPTDGTGRR